MKRFYLNQPLDSLDIINASDEIVRHINVLRLKKYETIELFDGNNQSVTAVIADITRKSVQFKTVGVVKKHINQLPQIILAVALVANDKMDIIVAKAVELGITNIVPIYSERSARLVDDRIDNRLSHWQNIIISSCCQCGQNQLPVISTPISLEMLHKTHNPDLKIIMHPYRDNMDKQKLQPETISSNPNDALLLVGPEGGFTDFEVQMAIKNNYMSLQLGSLILRAETAAIAGLSFLNLHLHKWNRNFI